MEKLPERFKKDWIEALRSGEYAQGKHELYNGHGGYCCLGVACVVATGSAPTGKEWIPYDFKGFEGLSSLVGSGNDNETAYKLASMNDDLRPFTEIADWIESNL